MVRKPTKNTGENDGKRHARSYKSNDTQVDPQEEMKKYILNGIKCFKNSCKMTTKE